MNGPILLFGMPRSGTTWIGKLFDSHPDTLYRHEPDSLRRLSVPLYPEVNAAQQYRPELAQFVASLPGMRSPEIVGKQPLFPKSYQSSAQLLAYRASVLAAKAVSKARRHAPCLYRPTGENSNRVRAVWKSIESLGRLGVCVEALPSARAIHLMRHPCGYVASVLRGRTAHRFIDQTSDTNDTWILRRLLKTTAGAQHATRLGDLAKLTHEEQLTWIWMITHERVLQDTAHNERVLTIRYEDVCASPDGMTRKMFEFTGLDWNQQTEAFVSASTEVPARTTDTDYYSVFKSPLASAGRWRAELTPDSIERVMRILGESPLSGYYSEDDHVPEPVPEVMT